MAANRNIRLHIAATATTAKLETVHVSVPTVAGTLPEIVVTVFVIVVLIKHLSTMTPDPVRN